MCVCITLSSDTTVMGPRRKASKLQPVGGSGEGQLVLRPTESKDYINELSHEVLCHIFRYTALTASPLYIFFGWVGFSNMCSHLCQGGYASTPVCLLVDLSAASHKNYSLDWNDCLSLRDGAVFHIFVNFW